MSAPKNSGWIRLNRSEEAEALLKNHPNAFLLLTQIALRARWRDCPISGLQEGQAWIGDWKLAGLPSEKAYRHAKNILEKRQIAAFKGASKGTVATLTNTSIFSLSESARGEQEDRQGADEGRTRGGQGATNKKDRRIEGEKETQELFAQSGASSARAPKSPSISWSQSDRFTGISETDRKLWAEAYPATDIDRELSKAHDWLLSNPTKAKKSNWRQFITRWLSKSQDRGGDRSQSNTKQGPMSRAEALASIGSRGRKLWEEYPEPSAEEQARLLVAASERNFRKIEQEAKAREFKEPTQIIRSIVGIYPVANDREKAAHILQEQHAAGAVDLEQVALGTEAVAQAIAKLPWKHNDPRVPLAADFFRDQRWKEDPQTWLDEPTTVST